MFKCINIMNLLSIIVNCEYISHLCLVFLFLIFNKYMLKNWWDMSKVIFWIFSDKYLSNMKLSVSAIYETKTILVIPWIIRY